MSKKNVHRWNATTLPTRARWVFLSISLLVNLALAQTDVTAAINAAPSFNLTVGYGQTNGTSVGAWGRNDGGQTNVPLDLTNVVAISAGYQHSLALRADGTVVAWGTNDVGQLNVPAGLNGVAAIAAGFSHNVVLLSNGTVIAWGGSNNYGETNVPVGLSNVVAIAAGAQRSAALLGDGTLRLWGLYAPALTNLTGVRAFSYGRAHGLALLENGTVVALGNNDYDQTNQPPNLTNVMAIAPGAYHNFVLHSNGTASTWGLDVYAVTGSPGGVDDIIAISACGFASLAIRSDGSMAVWGLLDSTMENQATPAGTPPYLAVSGGGHHAVALFANLVRPVAVLKGSGPFSTNSAAIDISAGSGESAQTLNFILTVADTNLFSVQPALSTNGTLTFTPAPNTYGTTTVSVVLVDNGGTGGGGDDTSDAQTFIIEIADANQPPTVSVPLSITALENTLGAITNVVLADPDDTGAAMAVTFSVERGYFQPTEGSGVTVNSGQRSESMTFTGTSTALNNFIAAGNVQFTPAQDEFGPLTLTVVVNDLGHGDEDVALTTTNTCTLDVLPVNDAPTFTLLYHNEDGLVPAGVNWIVDEGLLDPFPLSWTNLVSLAGGFGHYIGLRADGSVVGEEIGNEYSLGFGTIPDGLQDVSAIASGWLHNVVLKRDGTVVAWGWNESEQTNVPPGLDSVRAIAAGSAHTMALRSNGTVVAWGGYDTNLVQVPAGLTNVAAIAAGWTYPANDSGLECIALLSNEVVRVWFDHGNGLTNLSLSLPGVVGVTRSPEPGTVFALMNNSNAVVLDWTSGELVVSNRSEFSSRGFTNVAQIAATDYSFAAMYHDGWIEGVDYRSNGLFGAPGALTNVLSLFAGALNPMAIYQAPHQRLHLAEDAGAVSILVATNFSVGPTNETEPMAWLVTASDPSMFSQQPHFVSSNSGELEFTLAPNARGTNVLTVQLIDYGGTNYGGVDITTQTFTLVIAGTEDAPTAVADSYDATEDIIVIEPALTGVLANDTDVDGEELFASLVTDVSHGIFSLGTDGSFIYLPTVDFFGTDSFQYQATNNAGTSAVVTVTLTVNPANDPPVILSFDTDAAAGVEQSLSGLFAMDVDSGSNIVSLSLSSAVAQFSADSTAEVTAVTNGLPAGSLRLYGAMTNLITFLNATLVRLEVPTGVTTNISYSITVDDHGHIGTDPGTTGTATNEIASATNVIVVLPAATYVHVPADGVYGLGAPLDFTVQTSEPVIVDTTGGTPTIRISLWSPTRTATYLSGSGTTNLVFRYTVLAGDYAGSTPTVFSIIEANGGTLRDADGNNMPLSLLNIASTAGIGVDALEPEIAALIPPLTGTHPVNTALYFGVLFDEVVVVETTNGFPRLALTIGNTNVWAEYNTNASVGDFLSFTYTVRDGDLATNGIIVGQNIDLNGSTIRDVAGNNAQLDFGSNMPLTTVRVDTVPPEFVYAIHYVHSPYFPIGSELHFVAYVSEPVTVDTAFGVPLVQYQLDSGVVYGTYVSNDFDGQHLHFLYTVQAGDYATNGVHRSTNLVFNGAVIRDAAGNLASPQTTGPYLLESAIVDGFPPSATNDVIVPTNGIYQAGQQLTVTMEFTEPVVFRGSATYAVTFQIGAAQHVITNATQARSNELTFAYTIQAGDFDADGVTIATALQVEDLAGNTVTSNAFIVLDGVIVDASAPIADADSFTLGEDSVLAGVSVLDNDTDADTNTLTATLVSSTAHGVLDFNTDGAFTYTPATNFAGSDGFTYSITDGVLTSAVATVALTIVATNDPPTITGPLGLIVTNGVALPFPALSLADVDSDTNLIELVLVSGDLGSVFIATNRSGVTVSNDNGVFTHLWGSVSNLNAYLAATNVFYVADTNRVTHSDVDVLISDHGYTGADPGLDSNPAGESALLQIAIENGGINNPPVIGVGLTNQTGTYGSIFSYTFATNAFLEPDSQTLHYLASGLPAGVTFTDATRTFAGTPTAPGSYTVRVIAGDGQSPELFATNSFTFTVGKASLIVTADDKTRACGAPNPAFTIRYAGWIGADNVGGIDTPPVARTTATAVSPPGAFPISLTGGSDDNYTFTFVDGTLTITNGAGGTVRGVYHGLLHETNEVRHESSGAIQVKATDAGKYSGVLELAGRKLRLSGVFDGQRRATNRIERTGLAPLVVELILDACEPPQALLGNVTDGSWRAEIYGAPLRYHARTNPAPMAGRYTMVLPGADGDSTLPHGDGYGVITIATSGKLKFTGALGDGTKISDGSVINAAELWPLYVPLYKGQGSTLGWLLFSNAPASDLSGLVSWIRPAQSLGAYYRAGFTNETTTVGLRYVAPPKGTNILTWTNGIAIATGENLLGGVSNVFTVGPSHRVVVQGTNISSIVLSAKDGRFKGTLKNPANSKATAFNGVLLQGVDQGFGFFLGTNQSGRIVIEPAAETD